MTELLVALLLIVMVSTLLTELMVFSTSTTASYSRFGKQQFTVHDAFTRLNRDIEEAAEIKLSSSSGDSDYKAIEVKVDGVNRIWKLDDGKLYLDSEAVVEGLAGESIFKYSAEDKCLTVVLKPEPTNTGRYPFNINKAIVSQYDLEYKKISTD